MKSINQLLSVAGVAVLLGLSSSHVAAQGRGNFDPAQMKQRMMDRYKEQLEVKSDDEWKVISERVEKVTNLQRDMRIGGFGGGGRRTRGADGNADAAPATPRPNPFGGEPNVDLEALQKSLDAKASPEELKTKLAKLRASQKEKEGNLVKAQDELCKVLSVRQEATAVTMGLLK